MLPISLIITTSGEPFILYTKILNTLSILHLFSNVYIIVDCHFRNNNQYVELVKFIIKMVGLLKSKGNFILVKNYKNPDGHARLLETIQSLENLDKYLFLSEDDDFIINSKILEKYLKNAIDEDVDVMGPPEETLPDAFDPYFKKLMNKRPDLVVENMTSEFSAFKLNTGFATTNYFIKRKLIKCKKKINKYFKIAIFDKKNKHIYIERDLAIVAPHDVIVVDRSGLWSIKLYKNKRVHKLRYINKSIRNYIDDDKIDINDSMNYHFRFGHNIFACEFFLQKINYIYINNNLCKFSKDIKLNNYIYHWLILMKEMLTKYTHQYNLFDYYDTYIKNVNAGLVHCYNFFNLLNDKPINLYKDIYDTTQYDEYKNIYNLSSKLLNNTCELII